MGAPVKRRDCNCDNDEQSRVDLSGMREGKVICPKCTIELDSTYTRCPYCNGPLTEPPRQEPGTGDEPREPVTVASTWGDDGLVTVAKSLLESAQIPCAVRRFGRQKELVVMPEDADDARLILAEARESADSEDDGSESADSEGDVGHS